MRTRTGALLLLLTGCLSAAAAQSDGGGGQNVWNDPIQFKTKGGDACTMTVTGQGAHTRLRLSCRGRTRSYWCEYVGMPNTCRSYNKNPRHYFTQMMWGLRKLHNACQGPRQIKPQMCKRATDDSQMLFSSASFSPSWPQTSSGTGARAAAQVARLRAPAATTTRDSARRPSAKSIRFPPGVTTTQSTSPQPTTPPAESNARRMARQYCWRSLQGVCSYVIGLVRN